MKNIKQIVKAAKIIDRLARRKSKRYIEEVADALKEAGIIDYGPEVIRAMELVKARNIISATRDLHRRNGEVQLEFVSLQKEDPETGKTDQYFKRLKDCDKQEGAIHLRTCWKRRRIAHRRLMAYADFLFGKYPDLQLELGFDITEWDPAEEPQDA